MAQGRLRPSLNNRSAGLETINNLGEETNMLSRTFDWLATTLRLLGLTAALWVVACGPTCAQVSDDIVRLGLLLDMSGPYSNQTGEGSVVAARMAIEDFGETVLGKPVDLLVADHLNKSDLASSLAREWIDTRHLDAILDVNGTAPSLAVQDIVRSRNRIAIFASPAGNSDRRPNGS